MHDSCKSAYFDAWWVPEGCRQHRVGRLDHLSLWCDTREVALMQGGVQPSFKRSVHVGKRHQVLGFLWGWKKRAVRQGYKTARLGSTWTGPNLQDLVLWRWSSGRAQGHGAIGQVVFGQKSAGGWVCDSRLFGGLTGDFAGLAQFDHLLQLGVRDLKRKISLFKIN